MQYLTPIFIVAVFLLVTILSIKSRSAKVALQKLQAEKRAEGLRKYPGVFDTKPIGSIDEIDSITVRLFDMEMSEYIGETATENIEWIVQRFSSIHEHMLPNGHNDIPFSIDDLLDIEEFAPTQPDESFVDLMRAATDLNGYVTLRWVNPNA